MQFDHDLERIIPSSANTDSVTIGGSAGLNLPAGTTAQRTVAPVQGSTRFNTTNGNIEYYNGTIWVAPGNTVPGNPVTSIQYNGSGAFTGDAAFTFLAGANPRVAISGTNATTMLSVGGFLSPGNAAVYIEIDSAGAEVEGQRVYFNRNTVGINGWIAYDYDGSAPNIRLTDEDDDPAYIQFNTITTGTYAAPAYLSVFGARGNFGTRIAGANSGFAWYVGANTSATALITGGTSVMELDTQWLRLPTGTTAQRPTIINGMERYNTTLGKFDFAENGAWVNYYVLPTAANNTFLGGPTSGGPATPTFRTIALDDLSDVIITSPSVNQVVAYNGANWVNTGAVGANAAGLVGAGQAGAAAWTLVSGSTYRADFAHNLGTTNVVITVFNSSSNAVVIPDSVVVTNTNTLRVQAVGNTLTLRVVVVANGQSIVAGGSTPSSVIVSKDGVTVGTTTTKINFTGQAVNVTDGGALTTNVSIGARYSYVANSLDSPNNADFAVNALAPVTTDPTNAGLNVRSFSNTTQQGVAFTCSIPPNATQVVLKFRSRAQTAPGAASVVQPRLFFRQIPNNSAVSAWNAGFELANINIPTNAFFQYSTQTIALATLGLTADRLYHFELTRRVTGVVGTNLASNWLLAELTLEWS